MPPWSAFTVTFTPWARETLKCCSRAPKSCGVPDWDQTHRNLGLRLSAGIHPSWCPRPAVYRPDAVDIERRTYARALQRRVVLTLRLHVADFQRLLVLLRWTGALLNCRALFQGHQAHAHVVKAVGNLSHGLVVDEGLPPATSARWPDWLQRRQNNP